MRKRNVHIQFWLDKKEAEAFQKKVKKSGLSREAYAEKGYTSAFDCFCNFYDVSSCNHRRIFLP